MSLLPGASLQEGSAGKDDTPGDSMPPPAAAEHAASNGSVSKAMWLKAKKRLAKATAKASNVQSSQQTEGDDAAALKPKKRKARADRTAREADGGVALLQADTEGDAVEQHSRRQDGSTPALDSQHAVADFEHAAPESSSQPQASKPDDAALRKRKKRRKQLAAVQMDVPDEATPHRPADADTPSSSMRRKSVQFSLQRNLYLKAGDPVPPEVVRTPPSAKPKVRSKTCDQACCSQLCLLMGNLAGRAGPCCYLLRQACLLCMFCLQL